MLQEVRTEVVSEIFSLNGCAEVFLTDQPGSEHGEDVSFCSGWSAGIENKISTANEIDKSLFNLHENMIYTAFR